MSVLASNPATGGSSGAVTVTVVVAVVEPPGPVAVSVTVYVPGSLNVKLGFDSVLSVWSSPSNSQA